MKKKIISIYTKHKVIIEEFTSFFCVGVSGGLIHIGTTYILTEYLGMRYLISYFIGQFLGITNNFLWNKYKTFKKKDGQHIRQYILSIMFSAIIAVCSGAIVYVLTDYIGIWYMLSIMITVPRVAVVSYLSHKYIIFKK